MTQLKQQSGVPHVPVGKRPLVKNLKKRKKVNPNKVGKKKDEIPTEPDLRAILDRERHL